VNSSGASATLIFDTQTNTGPLDILSTCGPVSCETYQAGPATIISLAGSGTTIQAVVNTFEIFANPGATSAVIDLSMSCTISGILTLPGCVLPVSHLIIQGSTNNPVPVNSFSTLQGTAQSYGAFNVDWTGTLSATPYSPSSVPLPASAWLLLSGLGGVGLLRRRRSVKLDAA
jgi:hypothetical protein